MTQSGSPETKTYATVREAILKAPLIGFLLRLRFAKFGTVGLLGTFVNLAILSVGQEVLFRGIQPMETRLHLSLSLAIFLSTMNNFLWNRLWTWKDRKGRTGRGLVIQMAQYYLTCCLAIGLQYLFTVLISRFIHYLIANVIAIALAAALSYLLNDMWTFAVRKRSLGIRE